MTEEKIVNKIIPIETIKKIANYLEDKKDYYQKAFQQDELKNKGLKNSEKVYEYKGNVPVIEYKIEFKDGRQFIQSDYNWFIGNLNNLSAIKNISFYFHVVYISNAKSPSTYEHMVLRSYIYFTEETVVIRVKGNNIDQELDKTFSELKNIIEDNDVRYNKTVKFKTLRIQSCCLTIGFIITYILYLLFLVNKASFPSFIVNILKNKNIIVFGQWLLAMSVGNLIGYPIMSLFYKNILPDKKLRYNKKSHHYVHMDDRERFTAYNEVQIGKNAKNEKNRKIIEKLYKYTSKIVLVQIAISLLLFIILK